MNGLPGCGVSDVAIVGVGDADADPEPDPEPDLDADPDAEADPDAGPDAAGSVGGAVSAESGNGGRRANGSARGMCGSVVCGNEVGANVVCGWSDMMLYWCGGGNLMEE